jgi:hypothetical protein
MLIDVVSTINIFPVTCYSVHSATTLLHNVCGRTEHIT